MGWFDNALKQTRQEGIAEGREEGREEEREAGARAVMLRLVSRRFDPLPDAVRDAILTADAERLRTIEARLFSAARPEDLLA